MLETVLKALDEEDKEAVYEASHALANVAYMFHSEIPAQIELFESVLEAFARTAPGGRKLSKKEEKEYENIVTGTYYEVLVLASTIITDEDEDEDDE